MASYTKHNIDELVNLLNQQQVIAYPTEAVFGLGCDPTSHKAVNRLLELKKRSWRKGLILVAADYQQLQEYVNEDLLTAKQKDVIFSSWPGPVTWVMPAQKQVPLWLTGEFNSLAVRVSAHPAVKELCLRFGKPLVSTSANLNGQPPCKNYEQVKQQFGYDFPVLEGVVGDRVNPSEIRDALTGKLYRQG